MVIIDDLSWQFLKTLIKSKIVTNIGFWFFPVIQLKGNLYHYDILNQFPSWKSWKDVINNSRNSKFISICDTRLISDNNCVQINPNNAIIRHTPRESLLVKIFKNISFYDTKSKTKWGRSYRNVALFELNGTLVLLTYLFRSSATKWPLYLIHLRYVHPLKWTPIETYQAMIIMCDKGVAVMLLFFSHLGD